jgi:outer membrane protein TolC
MIRPNVAWRRLIMSLGAMFIAGCASVDFNDSIARANKDAAAFTKGNLALAQTDAQRQQNAQAVEELLRQPLSSDDAVRIALLNSPALQAMLATNWEQGAIAAQSGRIPNPLLSLSRMQLPHEIEIERALAFGLLDLLTLPRRVASAERRIEQTRLSLTGAVIDAVGRVRQAWVNAVAARQTLAYARQVLESAEASAELARRMQSAGNFTRLQRARQQVFYADAATAVAEAQQRELAAREELVRSLGLTDAQAAQLRLPERLPDLPSSPRPASEVSLTASVSRLDVRIAQSDLDAAAVAEGLTLVTSLTDIEAGLRWDTARDRHDGTESDGRGWEIGIRLPLFDWGNLKRDALGAQTLAAANRLEATVRSASSTLRQDYGQYRTAHDMVRHYRNEVLPLRKAIADENLLRYNGMLIGVFELLAEARQQVDAVIAAIEAERRFWVAEAALEASIIGKPYAAQADSPRTTASASSGAAAPH